MGSTTGIAWTDATFNAWWGCTKVGPGCDHCYAEEWAQRFGTKWGHGQERRFFGAQHWNEPKKWNRKAAKAGVPLKVFCASMADWADNGVPQAHRDQLFALIRETPWIRWQLLTKRIGNVEKMLPADWGSGYPNVLLGITVVNQEEADRDIPKLLNLPAVVRWLSIEPMLGPVDLWPFINRTIPSRWPRSEYAPRGPFIDWAIVGGESGPRARPMQLEWARSLVEQCKAAGAKCFVKQLGGIKDKRGDISTFPPELQVREFPDIPLQHGGRKPETVPVEQGRLFS